MMPRHLIHPAPPRAGRRTPDEQGQSLVEYGIILLLVGVAVILAIQFLSPSIGQVFSDFGNDAPVAPPALAGYTPPPTPTPDPLITPSPTATLGPPPTATATLENTPAPTPTNTPTYLTCEFQESGGVIVIEAEHYVSLTLGSGPATGYTWEPSQAYAGHSGDSALVASPPDSGLLASGTQGPRLDYHFYIENPGAYHLYVRGRAQSTGAQYNDDSLFYSDAPAAAIQTLLDAGGWVADSAPMEFAWRQSPTGNPLNYGPWLQNLSLWMREDGTVIDKIVLSTNAALSAAALDALVESPPAGNCPDPPPPPPPLADILFVVNDPGGLNASDAAVVARLTAANYDVTTINDNGIDESDATGFDVVLVSETVLSGNVGDTFEETAIPVVVMEALIFDDMSMSDNAQGTDFGYRDPMNQLFIVNPAHSLAAGLPAGISTSVYNVGVTGAMSWGIPNPASVVVGTAFVIAESDEVSPKPVIFAYEAGAAMWDGVNAPARRVGLFPKGNMPEHLRVDSGWLLFDAAIAWAAGLLP